MDYCSNTFTGVIDILDLQPYFIKELFEGNANIVLSTSQAVIWDIRTHHIANLQNIHIHYHYTSSVVAPSGISLIPELDIPSDFAGSLHWSSQVLDNFITLATTASYANYMLLHLGNNFQFTGGMETCQELAAVINDTAAPLFISQRLKVYQRNEVAESLTNSGCVNQFQSQTGKSLVIGVLVNYTAPSFNPFSFPFGISQPEVRLYITTDDQIEQQTIELALISTTAIKWSIYQIGFQDISFNIKMSDGSSVDFISQSVSYFTTQEESHYSTTPIDLLDQLLTEFDQVNLFSSSSLAEEINIRVIKNESSTAADNFNKFLKESIAFEFCSAEAYLFCLNKSTVGILSEYSYELSFSNDAICQSVDEEPIPCSLRPSLTLINTKWVCYEIITNDQPQVEYYSVEVKLKLISGTTSNGTGGQKRSLPDSPIERAQTILGFVGSTGVLSCTSTPDDPTIIPPNQLSIQLFNSDKEVVSYPAYIEMEHILRTNIKISDVSPGMLPILLSCYLSTSSTPVDPTDYQIPLMEIIKGSCPTREGHLFKLSASYYNSYLLNELFLQLSLVNSIDPFLVDNRRGRAQLIDKSYLHCQPSLCQLESSLEQRNLNTGYPMCTNLTSLCHISNAGDTQLQSLFPKLFASPFISTGKLVFNTYNRPISSTPGWTPPSGWTPPPCANNSTTAYPEPTSSVHCNFQQSVYTVWPLFLVFFAMMPLTYTCGGLMFCLLNRCSKQSNKSTKSKKHRLTNE
ncbi:hypothetical protein LOD99_13823 [Oopsacas minuta]|uniref:Uncharacterized protein n=1 Tax=Oopsacas minuta TaxID=111878 RepID=A0AAV7KI59_9METZ|nr:hypothetical protein LOD99_13823 [Oopsacas minuta]